MPSIYLAQRNSGNAIPTFQKKGIADLMPGVVGDVPLLIDNPPTTYHRRLFPYIIYTFLHNVCLLINGVFFYNLFKTIPTLEHVFNVPVCSFRFEKLEPAEIATLKNMGLQQDNTNANLFVGTPLASYLPVIYNLQPTNDRIRPGHVSFDAWFAYVFLMKGLHVITTVLKNMDPGWTVRALTNTGEVKLLEDDPEIHASSRKGPMEQAVDAVQGGVTFLRNYFVGKPGNDVSGFKGEFHIIGGPRTYRAGYFFPYFQGMNTADKDTAYDVFSSLFYGTLGESYTSSAHFMSLVRSGVRQLAFSQTGMALAHAYKVVGTATEMPGAHITIVLKGHTYVGIALETEHPLVLYGRRYMPGDISEEIGKVDLLRSQAEKLCALLNSVTEMDGTPVYTFSTEDFMTSRLALRAWNTVEESLFHLSDAYTQARELLSSMDFNDTYRLPTKDLVSTAVQYMAGGAFSLIENEAAFLGGTVLLTKGRVMEALSMFGPRVPSFNTGKKEKGSGPKFVFPAPGKEDTNLVKVNGVRPLKMFAFWPIPINEAHRQWSDAINHGAFGFPSARKNRKEFTDMHAVQLTIDADPAFTEMYDRLKGMANEARASGAAIGKRKRGLAGEDKPRKKGRADFVGEL